MSRAPYPEHVSKDAQLAWEAKWARPAALAAAFAATLPIAGVIVPRLLLDGPLRNRVDLLLAAGREPEAFVAGGIVQALGMIALAGVFVYLHDAARARYRSTPPVARILAVVGPLLLAAVYVATQVAFTSTGAEFAASGSRTTARADQLVRAGPLATIESVRFGAGAAFGIAWILIGLSIMRAGLVSRFVGTLGIVIGVLNAIPIILPVVLQTFWLGAIAVLLLDRWPGGRGPAWETADATPWPARASASRGRAVDEASRSDTEAPEGTAGAREQHRASDGDEEPRPMAPRKRKRRR